MNERTARDDLAMIRRLMEQGRDTVEAGAPHYVVWGFLLAVALVAEWAIATGRLAVNPMWVWAGTVGVGWIASVVVGARSARRAAVRTAGGRALMAIWIGAGVILTLTGFVGIGSGAVPGHAMLGLTAAVVGGAVFATSFVHDSRLVRLGAVAWWAGAAVLFVWRAPAAILLLAGLVVALMLAPGVWLLVRRGGPDVAAAAGAGGTGR